MPKRWTVYERRKRLGLTQEELSRRSGVRQTDISKIELGKIEQPLFAKGLALADALEIDPHDLRFAFEEEAVAS